jgi:hypothetical protein
MRVQLEHTVRISRAVLVLADAQLQLEAIPLVRLSLECAVTAAWLAITPGSGKAAYFQSTKDFRDLYKELIIMGLDDPEDDTDIKKIEADLEKLEAHRKEEARNFRDRCSAVDDGIWLYGYYRLFSKTSHGGANLNDEYLEQVEQTADAPLGLAMREPFPFALWPIALGFQVTMLFNALRAWDSVSEAHPRRADLECLAEAHDFATFTEVRYSDQP